jgi:hypothetical protein
MSSDDKASEIDLEVLSESELMSLRFEIGQEINRLAAKRRAKLDLLALIKNEMAIRAETRQRNGGFLVTDHAIVRYLERHKGLDIEAIKGEIFTLANAGKEIEGSDRVKNGSAVLAIRKEARAITTILNDKEHDMIT